MNITLALYEYWVFTNEERALYYFWKFETTSNTRIKLYLFYVNTLKSSKRTGYGYNQKPIKQSKTLWFTRTDESENVSQVS